MFDNFPASILAPVANPLKHLSTNHSKISTLVGRGGGQVVSVLAFYSNDPSSNRSEAYRFLCKFFVWKARK